MKMAKEILTWTSSESVEVKTWEELSLYLKQERYRAVVYLDHQVLIGEYKQGIFSSYQVSLADLTHVRILRVFNDHQELFLRRAEKLWKGRLRIDSDLEMGGAKHLEYNTREFILVGTKSNFLDQDYTEISEERGAKLILPGQYQVNEKETRAFLSTRHYIDYLPTGQAGFVDMRFTHFGIKGGK